MQGIDQSPLERELPGDVLFVIMIEKLAADGTPLEVNSMAYAFNPIPQPRGPVGRLRASMRALDPELSQPFRPVYALDAPQKLSSGEIVALDIAIVPMAMKFHAGEGLRLSVRGQYIAPTPRTIDHGTHGLHSGGERGSYRQLPKVPWREQ